MCAAWPRWPPTWTPTWYNTRSTSPRVAAGGPDAGPIGQLPLADRFHWLTAPRSTIIQTSPVHTGLCTDPDAALTHLLNTMVRLPAPGEGNGPGAADDIPDLGPQPPARPGSEG